MTLDPAATEIERQLQDGPTDRAPHPPLKVDVWACTPGLEPDQLDVLAQVLSLRGTQPRQQRMRETCFKQAARLQAGMRVVELGAGTGIVSRELARIVGRDGRVIGVDQSPALLAHAEAQGTPPGGAPIEYRLGDARHVDCADGTFDAAAACTLLCHLAEPEAVIDEMRRLTRPGGTIMLLDQDYQTLVFNHPDTALTRRILLHGADTSVMDGWCGRKLPGLLARSGVKNVQCQPFVYVERDARSYLITIAQRFALLACSHGVISAAEAEQWLDELIALDREAAFLGSMNYYFVYGTR